MKRINVFYVVVGIIGILLLYLLMPENNGELSFYGFAESNETDINYNYPVVVERIFVSPGQEVKMGDTLMYLSRRQTKESLDDFTYEINKIKAEENIWRQKKQDQISLLNVEKEGKLQEIESKIRQLKEEIKFKKSLSNGLESIDISSSDYNPIELKISELKSESQQTSLSYDLKMESLRREMSIGASPVQEEIEKLRAKQQFEEDQKVRFIVLLAPNNGLIGNISCKEEEHIPSYSTLMTFYEPHSGLIRGFVHEDLTLQVEKGNEFKVTSLKNSDISYNGRVTGLGSRIVEIPTRLRQISNIKTYGREVLIEIPKENVFLQKEKVGLSILNSDQ